jgi:hypothetical protein
MSCLFHFRCTLADNVIGAAGKLALVGMLRLNFVLRVMWGIECGAELACHYRVPHVRCIARVRVMCQAGRARAADARGGVAVAVWLCELAPLWVVVAVCALLRDRL